MTQASGHRLGLANDGRGPPACRGRLGLTAAALVCCSQEFAQLGQVCVFDNRGVGQSDSPPDREHYTTNVMAHDVIELMWHLRWERAHIVGFSLGGMIATRFAVLFPAAVQSLTLISVTGGRWECIPR